MHTHMAAGRAAASGRRWAAAWPRRAATGGQPADGRRQPSGIASGSETRPPLRTPRTTIEPPPKYKLRFTFALP